MTSPRNDAIEHLVISRIAEVVGGTPRRVDNGSADGLHDHELELADGRLIAVEITGEVNAAAHETHAATRKNRLTDSGVTGVWDVSLADWNAHRGRLAERLPALLTEYEVNGRRRVTTQEDPRLAALDVDDVEMYDGDGAGIYLTRVGPANSIGPVNVLDAVSRHGVRTDNVAKLTRASADERHLAVWFDITAGDAFVALNDFGLLPELAPAVHAVIDAVWALRLEETSSGPDIDIVWSWTRAVGWTYRGRSPAVLPGEP